MRESTSCVTAGSRSWSQWQAASLWTCGTRKTWTLGARKERTPRWSAARSPSAGRTARGHGGVGRLHQHAYSRWSGRHAREPRAHVGSQATAQESRRGLASRRQPLRRFAFLSSRKSSYSRRTVPLRQSCWPCERRVLGRPLLQPRLTHPVAQVVYRPGWLACYLPPSRRPQMLPRSRQPKLSPAPREPRVADRSDPCLSPSGGGAIVVADR